MRSIAWVDGPIRVLLCDDHVVVREGLHKLLAEFGDVEVVGQALDGSAVWRLRTSSARMWC